MSAMNIMIPTQVNRNPVNSTPIASDCLPRFCFLVITSEVYQNERQEKRKRAAFRGHWGIKKPVLPGRGTGMTAMIWFHLKKMLYTCNNDTFRVNSVYMKVNAIIPARYKSSRLAGKPLLKVNGKTIIQMVSERVLASPMLDKVVVATDDERIFDHVTAFGGTAVMTSPEHCSGTDRIAEVARTMDADVIVNVQGDEPLITRRIIDALVQPFQNDSSLKMSTVMTRITNRKELFDPNVVKVVCNGRGDAIYFSRSPIPFKKSPEMRLPFELTNEEATAWFKHVGIYGYTRTFLLEFAGMEPGKLEKIEGLEQLRALENGIRIHVEQTDYSGIGIDTNEDYLQLKALLGDTE